MQEEKIELSRSKEAIRVTWVGFIINTFLTIFKIFSGIVGCSEAMLADGIHSLSDFFTDIIVLIGFKFTDKPADQEHNFGHGKYETFSTAIIGGTLLFVGINIFQKGITMVYRVIFLHEQITRPGFIAILAAIFSIVSKELLFRYNKKVGEKIKSPSVIANGWHHRSDAFSSLGTLIGISLAYFLGDLWIICDPIAAIIVSIFIFKVAVSIMMPAVKELLEVSLDEDEIKNITLEIEKYSTIIEYHHLRTRRVGANVAIEAHLLFNRSISLYDAHEVSEQLEKKLKVEFGQESIITFHLEPYLK
ncbi:MAG: cation transporter [Clostridia bacterium]|nr:cation transporter [Clostridia bacterium]